MKRFMFMMIVAVAAMVVASCGGNSKGSEDENYVETPIPGTKDVIQKNSAGFCALKGKTDFKFSRIALFNGMYLCTDSTNFDGVVSTSQVLLDTNGKEICNGDSIVYRNVDGVNFFDACSNGGSMHFLYNASTKGLVKGVAQYVVGKDEVLCKGTELGWYSVSWKGDTIVKPAEYTKFYKSSKGYVVCVDGQYGVIDAKGNPKGSASAVKGQGDAGFLK